MNITYLSVLTTADNHKKNDYTVVKNNNDDFKKFIMDSVDFGNADVDSNDFLTYSELSGIKLSPRFNVQKNVFELKKGFDLLSLNTVEKIIDASGLSLELLKKNLKELDKNQDGKITSNEINPSLTKTIDNQKRDYKASEIEKITQKVNSKAKKTNGAKQIEALDKQIESLKKMLRSLKARKIQQPTETSVSNSNDTKDISATGIDKKLAINDLKSKYGSDDIDKLVSTIARASFPTKQIASIMYQSGTQASEKEVTALANITQDVALNKIAVEQTSDLNAIEQLSPANTPLNLDSKNIDFSISSVEQKIQDLEEMKDKILQNNIENV